MPKRKHRLGKRLGTMLLAPIFFLVIGYSLMYIVGQPVIQFTKSSLDLFLLSDVPNFDKDGNVKEVLATKTNEKEIPSSKINYPVAGIRYGQIKVPIVKLKAPLYFGDSPDLLRKGAGQYIGSVFPGELGTTLVGGHNTDGFGRLIGTKKNDLITVQTKYGYYQYQVQNTGIYNKLDSRIKEIINQRKDRRLLLYTCYPIDSLGMTDKRLFINAKLVSGPIINESK